MVNLNWLQIWLVHLIVFVMFPRVCHIHLFKANVTRCYSVYVLVIIVRHSGIVSGCFSVSIICIHQMVISTPLWQVIWFECDMTYGFAFIFAWSSFLFLLLWKEKLNHTKKYIMLLDRIEKISWSFICLLIFLKLHVSLANVFYLDSFILRYYDYKESTNSIIPW